MPLTKANAPRWAPICVVAALMTAASPGRAETVKVKYFGLVDLSAYRCHNNLPSSFVWRICHRSDAAHIVVNLGGTYYAYCGMPAQAVSDWLDADSLGRHYNQHVKGRFACG